MVCLSTRLISASEKRRVDLSGRTDAQWAPLSVLTDGTGFNTLEPAILN